MADMIIIICIPVKTIRPEIYVQGFIDHSMAENIGSKKDYRSSFDEVLIFVSSQEITSFI